MKPIGDNILIELISKESQSSGGILLSENAKDIQVVAISDSVTSVKPGDLIEVAKNSIVNAGDWMFVKEKDVIAIRGNS